MALPRYENNSESSVIKSCHGEAMEPSFIRQYDNTDSKSVLRLNPVGGEGTYDGKSLVTPEGSEFRNDPSIVSFASSTTLIQADTDHRMEQFPLDPSIASLTIHGIVEEEPLGNTGSIISEPASVIEPSTSTTEASTTGNQLEPSVASTVSSALFSTTAGQFSNISHSEPTFRHFPKDPSVVEHIPSILEDEDYQGDTQQTSDVYATERSHRVTNDTFPRDHELSGNSNSRATGDSLSVNLVRRSTASTGNGSNWLNTSSNGLASNYFERSLIEEFNHLIEEEQRDSSVMSIPMVPAVLDDATTLVSVAPQMNTAATVGQQQQPDISSLQNRNVASQGTSRPPAPPTRRQSQPILPRQLPMKQLSKLRQEFGLPVGVVMEIARYQKRAYTYFVCDTNNIEEDCLRDCAHLAAAAQSEIVFCLGNNTTSQELLYPPPTDPQMADIQRQRQMSAALQDCVAAIRCAAWSAAPTAWTIQKLFELVQRIPRLEYWQREKISVVIVTNRTFGYNGQPELTNFINAIKSLLQIHVQVTIRLSTLDANIVKYYASMKQAFPSVSLLSAYESQNALIQKHNPWLNYGEPLHRLRELGYHFHHSFDLLSQRKLNKDEVRVFFVEFYGKKAMLYSPDLFTEWDVFYRFVDTINNREGKHRLGLNSKNREHREYWINIRRLDKAYANRRSSLSWRSPRSSARSLVPSKMDQESLRVEL